jgi:hypothetical protein
MSPKVTTLSNGVTIVTEDACATSTVTMTYPKAGSSNELLSEHGAALLNKHLCFKSASGMSSLLINRSIEDEGGIPFVNTNRFNTTLGYSVIPEKALGLLPLLATQCTFEKWDVRDAKVSMMNEIHDKTSYAPSVLLESVFAAAYGSQTMLGRPYYTEDSVHVSLEDVVAFRARGYGLHGAILSATGVSNHDAFCTEAETLFSNVPTYDQDNVSSASAVVSNSVYMGGESRVPTARSGYAHVAIVFPILSTVSSPIKSTLKHLLTLLGSSAGCVGFAPSNELVGLYGGSTSAIDLVDTMISTLKSPITTEIIHRAKTLAKADALFALENGSQSVAIVMTSSIVDSCTFAGPASIAASYDAITDNEIKTILSSTLKSIPSVAAVGDVALVPYHAAIVNMLK